MVDKVWPGSVLHAVLNVEISTSRGAPWSLAVGECSSFGRGSILSAENEQGRVRIYSLRIPPSGINVPGVYKASADKHRKHHRVTGSGLGRGAGGEKWGEKERFSCEHFCVESHDCS